MHRQTTTFSSRMNRVFTHRANRVSKAIERQGIRATYELHDRLLSNRSARERFASSPPQLDDAQRGILDEVQQHGFAVRSFDRALLRAEWEAIAEQRDRFVSATEADLAAGGEHVRVRAGKEFVVRLQSYGVELGARRSLVQGRLLAPPARPREHLRRDVVEARVRRRLVLRPAARGGRAHLVAALAPRLQRQAPAQGLPLPRGRRREHGAVPVRRRQPARWPVRGRVGLAAARPELPDRGGARGPRSQPRPCRPSPARRARCSSATPRDSTAGGSRRRSRACSRPRRTRRRRRSRP